MVLSGLDIVNTKFRFKTSTAPIYTFDRDNNNYLKNERQ